MEKIKAFLKRKNIIISAKRYGIDALGAMAQGLFASLLIGTIISTIGEQAGIQLLVDIGGLHCSVRHWCFFHWQPSVWPQIPWVEQADRWQY